ncbi:phage tail protein [Bacillus licheniformis]|uniref:phage tail protein n=1 Tax=Bacillus licheniformis TaxID=1402 RepID=UPI003BF64680
MIERLTAIVDAEIGKFKRKMGEVKALARSIPNRITVTVKENFKEAERRMGVFESRMARLSRVINDFQTVFGNAFSGMKMSIFPALVPAIASLTAALGSLGPVIGVASGGLMGLASSFGTAAAGAGAFGALAISNISGVFKASSDLAKLQQKLDETTDLKERAKIMEKIKAIQESLGAEERKALDTLEDFKANWREIAQETQKPILKTFTNSLNSFKSVLNTLRPMFKSVAAAGLELSESFQKSLNAPDVQKFFDYMNKNAGPQFATTVKTMGNYLRGFLNLLVAFGPLGQQMSQSMLKSSEAFAKWTASLSGSDKFKSFIQYVQQNGPKLLTILKNIGSGLIGMFTAFAPMSADMLTGLVNLTARFKEWGNSLSESKGFQEFINYVRQNTPTVLSLIGQLRDLIVNLGVGMAPLGSQILQMVTGFLKFTNSMMETNPIIGQMIGYLITFGGLFRALTPLTVAFSAAFKWKDAISTVKKLGTAIKWIGSVIGMVGKAFLTNPILMVVAAIAAAAYLIITNWKPISEFFVNLWEGIKTNAIAAWNSISEFFSGLWSGIVELASTAWGSLTSFFSSLWSGITTTAQAAWTGFMNLVKPIWDGIVAVFGPTFNVIVTTLSNIWNTVSSTVSSVWNTIKTTLIGVVTSIVDGVKNHFSILSQTLSGIWNGITSIAKGAWQVLKNAILGPVLLVIDLVQGDFKGFANHLKQIWTNISNGAKQIWNGIKTVVSSLVKGLVNAVKNYWNTAKTVTTTIFNGIKSVLSSIWNGIKNTVVNLAKGLWNAVKTTWNTFKTVTTTIFNAVKTVLTTVWNAAKSVVINAAKNIWSSVRNNFNNMKNVVTTVMKNVKTTIQNLWNNAVKFLKGIDLKQIGKNIIQGLINGIGSMANAVWRKVGDIADGVKKKITGLLNIHSPSRWMRDHVGKMIPAGVAVGIDKARGLVDKATQKMAQLTMFTPEQTTFAYDTSLSSGTLSDVRGQIEAEVSDFEISDRPIIIEMDGREVGRGTYKYVKEFQSREDGRRTTINR